MTRRIFIGDIQGCRVELERLLEEVGFDPAGDHHRGALVPAAVTSSAPVLSTMLKATSALIIELLSMIRTADSCVSMRIRSISFTRSLTCGCNVTAASTAVCA